MLRQVLKEELIGIRDRYGDDRLTEIEDVEDEIDIEDLIEEEQCVFTMSHAGYIKRVPASTYRSQKRGGKGVTGMTTKERTLSRASSPPPRTTTSSSSRTTARCTARRAIRSPRRAARPRARIS
jgi:DNA gyrase/topoisomerase IV subunit A